MPKLNREYGWIPDLPDQRDQLFAAAAVVLTVLPPKVDLRPKCPPVVDQGRLESCTANAIANAHRFNQMKQGVVNHFLPSRLFIYYNERAIQGTINSDSGATIRDGMKTLADLGACPEKIWPYSVSRLTKKPPVRAFREALKHQAIAYRRVTQSLSQMKGCLASGYPFVFGFVVYDSFESQAVSKTGKVPLPGSGESQVGGHAVLAVGYDDPSQRFIVMNSWSVRWGDQGYCYLPYAYLTDVDLAADFWTLRIVEV
jgi:C1A family cysteine protease